MNQEAHTITDPVEKNSKLVQIQEANEHLELLYDTNQVVKKEIKDFNQLWKRPMYKSNNLILL